MQFVAVYPNMKNGIEKTIYEPTPGFVQRWRMHLYIYIILQE